jgi:hypothetical protein
MGDEIKREKSIEEQYILYAGSRGSHQPGSLGGFTGVSALVIENESVFASSKQSR